MATIKTALVGLVLVLDLSSAQERKFDIQDGRHNITMGHMSPYDILLFHDSVRVDSSWFPYPRARSMDVCYPDTMGTSRARIVITAFTVTDLLPRGSGGYTFLTQGGVNEGRLCLHLKTRRGRGLHSNIDVFGHYV